MQKNKCSRIEGKYIEDLIDKDVYNRNRIEVYKKIEILQNSIDKLTAIKTEYSVYLERVLKILSNLSHSYQHSTVSNKIKLLKLIFEDKIIFDGEKIIEAPLTELIFFLQEPEKLFRMMEHLSRQVENKTNIIMAIFEKLYDCHHEEIIFLKNKVRVP